MPSVLFRAIVAGVAALLLSACAAGKPPAQKECGGNNCRHEKFDPDPATL